MYAFLFLCIPCALAFFFLTRRADWQAFVPPAALGLFVAIAVAFVRGFFIVYTHLWPAQPARSFAYLLLRDTLVPCAVLWGVYLLFSRADWLRKAAAFMPLTAAFYAVYVPFFVLFGANQERFSLFMLCAKPALFVALPLACSSLLVLAVTAARKKNAVICALCSVGAVLALAVPPLVEVLWYYNPRPALWGTPAAVFAAAAVALHVLAEKTAKAPVLQ